MVALPEAVSSVSPLGAAVDGGRKGSPKPRPGKGGASGTYEGWACPRCKEEFPHGDAVRHLIAEINSLEDTLSALAAEGVRTELDELGNVLVHGPGPGEWPPAVWLQFRNLAVDSSIQREQEAGHELMRPGVRLDQNKTEALSVAPLYAPGEDGSGGFALIGYRVVEGQHRALLGLDQDPDGYQLCKIVEVESRQEESRLARQISHSRKGFKALTDWYALLREGQPNVAAAAGFLADNGYLITKSAGRRGIAAAGAIFRIIGVQGLSEPAVRAVKSPAEGAEDLEHVLMAIEGIRAEGGEGNRRYASVLLTAVYEVITGNRDVINPERLARQAGIRTAREWLALNDQTLGGRKYLRAHLIKAYNSGLKTEASKIS